jgi:hypothetical protein
MVIVETEYLQLMAVSKNGKLFLTINGHPITDLENVTVSMDDKFSHVSFAVPHGQTEKTDMDDAFSRATKEHGW